VWPEWRGTSGGAARPRQSWRHSATRWTRFLSLAVSLFAGFQVSLCLFRAPVPSPGGARDRDRKTEIETEPETERRQHRASADGRAPTQFHTATVHTPCAELFFFFTRVTGPRRSMRLKLCDTRVYEPQIRALLGSWSATTGASSAAPAPATTRLVKRILVKHTPAGRATTATTRRATRARSWPSSRKARAPRAARAAPQVCLSTYVPTCLLPT